MGVARRAVLRSGMGNWSFSASMAPEEAKLDSEGQIGMAADASLWLAGMGRKPEGLGTIDGRVDLRGFKLPDAVRAQVRDAGGAVPEGAPVKMAGARWTGIDFTGADFTDVVLDKVLVEDCVFDKASLAGTRWAGCTVKDSRFHGANMRSARLSIRWSDVGSPSRWVGCSFDGAMYFDDSLDFTEFIGCRLHFKRWRDITYVNCHFEDCSFAGAIQRVEFDSRPLEGSTGRRPNWATEPVFPTTFERCDFSSANLVDVRFSGCTFGDVEWSADAWLLEVPQYGRSLPYIDAHPDVGDAEAIRRILVIHGADIKWPVRPESTLILALSVFRRDPLTETLAYIDVFREANEALGLPQVRTHGPQPDGN